MKVVKMDYSIRVDYQLIPSDSIMDISVDWGIFDGAAVIGCVQAQQLIVSIRSDIEIPRQARITLSGTAIRDDGSTESNIGMGDYFVSRREHIGDTVRLTCYDPVLKMSAPYLQDGETGEWPRPMVDVARDICMRVGVSLAPWGTQIDPSYQMGMPTDMSMRDIMASIAAAHGANWICANSMMRMVQIGDHVTISTAEHTVRSLEPIGEPWTYTGVRLSYTDSDYYMSGDDSGRVLEGWCDWATQQMCDNILADIKGKTLMAWEGGIWMGDSMVRPGWSIQIGDDTYFLATMSGTLTAGWYFDCGLPGESAEEDEYPYEGPITRSLAKKVSTGKPYYGVSISRQSGLVVDRSDGAAETILNADTFAMRAKDDTGAMRDCIYFDALARRYRITGQVEIDGAMIAESMYADMGAIADLTVSRVLTSRRIALYLSQDTSRDNYVSVHDNSIDLISASVVMGDDGSPQTEQMVNDDGKPLYWAGDITEATVVDGHYEIDGSRVPTTTTPTDWPVIVYQYTGGERVSITFGGPEESYAPVIVMGAGTGGPGDAGKAKIRKIVDGLDISYRTSDGKDLTIKMDDGGRIYMVDTLTRIDTTQADKIVMTYGGSAGAVEYGWASTATGYRLTTPEGQVIDIDA